MLQIEAVLAGSYAEELGLLAGDKLLTVNGREIHDLIDYHLSIEVAELRIDVLHQDEEVWEFDIQNDPYVDFGLVIAHPRPHQCGNKCLFCFVHQLPKGMRRSLYIKDEDYRFSYLYGSYITLTNLSEVDIQRIIKDQLSPLFISVHATDNQLREIMLGTKVPEIMPLLKRLTNAGIELNCQVVLCPGINDGNVLQQTICDLVALYPSVLSLAVVPVGLTKHRFNLPNLDSMTIPDAVKSLELIHTLQQKFLIEHGTRFVFPADEFYLLTQEQIPPATAYEDFSQLENGVGMIAQFRQQIDAVLEETEYNELDKIILVTGCSFQHELEAFASSLSEKCGVELVVVAIKNIFFGDSVTVTGLVTGNDLISQLQHVHLGSGVIIPEVMLKNEENIFLDDVTIEAVNLALQTPVIAVENSPWGILDGLEQLAVGGVEVIEILQ